VAPSCEAIAPISHFRHEPERTALYRVLKKNFERKTGAITFVQRFRGAINLNVHMHSLFLDGVYFEDHDKLKFFQTLEPTDNEIAVLVKRIRDRVVRNLTKKGYAISDFSEDPFAFEQPAMAELAGASIQSRIAFGERAGQRVRRIRNRASIGGRGSTLTNVHSTWMH